MVTSKNGKLVFDGALPLLEKPEVSKSGKAMHIVKPGTQLRTTINGSPVVVQIMAYSSDKDIKLS